jgi:hypothetical protein
VRVLAVAERAPTTFGSVVGAFPCRAACPRAAEARQRPGVRPSGADVVRVLVKQLVQVGVVGDLEEPRRQGVPDTLVVARIEPQQVAQVAEHHTLVAMETRAVPGGHLVFALPPREGDQ